MILHGALDIKKHLTETMKSSADINNYNNNLFEMYKNYLNQFIDV